MPDISTVWDPQSFGGDWAVNPPDLLTGSDLETAIMVSLFTDRTADPDDVIPDGANDPRGWWGDLGQAYPVGSKIWLRMRDKLTPQTVALVKDDIVRALQWLLDDGVAAAIDVVCQAQGLAMLAAQITLHQPSGPPAVFNYSWVWAAVS